jgi:hypothetical protein
MQYVHEIPNSSIGAGPHRFLQANQADIPAAEELEQTLSIVQISFPSFVANLAFESLGSAKRKSWQVSAWPRAPLDEGWRKNKVGERQRANLCLPLLFSFHIVSCVAWRLASVGWQPRPAGAAPAVQP